MEKVYPSYLALYESGELQNRINALEERIETCTLCPHECGSRRFEGETGECGSGVLPRVASWHAHHGEERPISGRKGSGTIFFSGCNLHCVFCQNCDISQQGYGREIGYGELARAMVGLQERGCHNINLVTPTHMSYPALRALDLAVPMGLRLPLVYNTGGYEEPDVIRLLDGIVDIYMPDMKYMDSELARELSDAPDYVEKAMASLRVMHDQVGDLEVGQDGVALRGLLVRHLMLPGQEEDTDRVIDFCYSISPRTCINVMDQYRPAYRSRHYPGMGRHVDLESHRRALEKARRLGLRIC